MKLEDVIKAQELGYDVLVVVNGEYYELEKGKMNVGKSIDLIDQETGEVYYTCHSKYGGQATMDNAFRYCRRHGYEFTGLDTNSSGNVFMWVREVMK